MPDVLPSWNDGAARRSLLNFVAAVTRDGAKTFVPPEQRIAVFDNDGTLWCEKPVPVEVGFVLGRLAMMAKADASLRERQPWQAAYTRDYSWLATAITRHYHGDDSDARLVMDAVLKAFDGMSIERYETYAAAFLRHERHPTLKCALREATYRPMVELLRHLEANGFATFIASGGDRDFLRTVTQDIYGVPPERVIGSSQALRYQDDPQGGTLVYKAAPEVFDDGAVKPVRIWSRIGRRPILAVGNSNGDIPMLQFAGSASGPAFRMLINHDDREREFHYRAGAERALELAGMRGWTVVSMKHDWNTVFAVASETSSAA